MRLIKNKYGEIILRLVDECRAKGRCAAIRCCHKPAVSDCLCHRHRKMVSRARHPERALFSIVRDRARRKGLAFTLSFAWFKALMEKHGYKKGSGLHLDRRDFRKGYTPDNVQVLLAGVNISKGNKERAGTWREEEANPF